MLQPSQALLTAHCDYCGEPFFRGRADHRFCCVEHNQQWHIEERRAAIAAWRKPTAIENLSVEELERRSQACGDAAVRAMHEQILIDAEWRRR